MSGQEIQYIKFFDVENASKLGDLAKGIAECVHSAFGGTVTEEDAYAHMIGDVIMTGTEDGKVVCFSNTSFGTPNEVFEKTDISDIPGCYLAGATISKEAQGRGLYKDMNKARISMGLDKGMKLVFTRTQNPRVEAGIKTALEEFQREKIINEFEMERILLPGFYGKMLTSEKPNAKDINYDELDFFAGDAYILLFHIS